MSERDEDGRYIPDHSELAEAWDEKQRRRFRGCLCGYPDWPGQCPGPANCPVHGENMRECSRCGEECDGEPDGCRDPNCPMIEGR